MVLYGIVCYCIVLHCIVLYYIGRLSPGLDLVRFQTNIFMKKTVDIYLSFDKVNSINSF